ncbi:MAG: efflux RND transporter permease subunit [Fidelibacterota bacterium]|nr:MAG: efflux RND transporter permease subunit [Candidatus Neomarinimicrobiota bacterium]
MYALARYATRRPVAITVLAAAVVVLGLISGRGLPLDLLPDLQSPTVLVSIRSGDRPPTEMERLYGEQVEQRLFTVRGIRAIDQVARTGILIARVTFEWHSDMDLALVDVQKAVNPIASDIDVDEVLVRRQDPRQLPVLTLGLVAPEGRPDLTELRRIARRQVAPALEQLEGVAEVRVTGGREEEVRVLVDGYLMEAHGVTMNLLEQRIVGANFDIDAGTLEEGDNVYLVRGLSRFRKPEDIAQVVVKYERDSEDRQVPVRVEDLGQVFMANREITDLVRVDEIEGVGLSAYKEAGANTVSVSRTVRDALERLGADLPGVEVRIVSDEAALVEDAIDDVEEAALIGILLAILVLTLFLRSAGPTIVVATAVPVSLMATLFAMHFAGHSLNLMTLGGLALGAGMLVDNAIVVVESIFRRRSEGDPPEEAASRGTALVAGAIAASTLTTCVVFLPVLFVRGLAARLVSGLSFSVVVSLIASLAVAVFLIPALAGWFLPRRKTRALDPGKGKMEAIVLRLLRHPFRVVAVSILLVAVAINQLLGLGTELLAPADPREFSLRLIGPPGQRVESTEKMTATVEAIIKQAAGSDLRAILSEVGRLPEDDRLIREERSGENTARILVRLTAGGKTASQVVRSAAPAVEGLPNVEVSWEVGTSNLARALGTTGPPIQVEISGRSLGDLRLGAEKVLNRLKERSELWNVRSSFEGGPPELHVILNRTLCDGLGVEMDTIANILETVLDGRRIDELSTGDEERDIVLRLKSARRVDLKRLPFTTDSGQRLAVGDVAHFEPVEGALEIFRRDQRRIARVTARIAPGVEYPAAREAVEKALEGIEMSPGSRIQLTGEEEERKQTFSELQWAMILSLLLVFMVLAGTFESLVHPITVLASVPLAFVGVAIALVPSGKPIGVMSVIGIIVLGGIAVNDAILLVQTARQLMAEGLERKIALARAAAIRLRPIMMTTTTTVLALLPLAIGAGEAAQLRSPLALTIIGGIIASTCFSLLVIPCLYLVLDFFRFKRVKP